MTKDEFIQQAINLIRATEPDGYSMPYRKKVIKLYQLADEYEKQNKQ